MACAEKCGCDFCDTRCARWYEEDTILEFVKDKEDKTYDCGDCRYFITSGLMAPSGYCYIHQNFNDCCMSYDCFPEWATICNDFYKRRK